VLRMSDEIPKNIEIGNIIRKRISRIYGAVQDWTMVQYAVNESIKELIKKLGKQVEKMKDMHIEQGFSKTSILKHHRSAWSKTPDGDWHCDTGHYERCNLCYGIQNKFNAYYELLQELKKYEK